MNQTREHKGDQLSNREAVTLFLAGDVMTGRGIDQILPYSVDPRLYERYVKSAKQYVRIAEEQNGSIPENASYEYIWGAALKILDRIKPDLRIINLETAITTHSDPLEQKLIHYRMHPNNVEVLKKANIDICTLANNHVLDWGTEGLKDTLSTLRKNDIQTAGAGVNQQSSEKPAVYHTAAQRVLVFSYATTSAGLLPSWQAGAEKPGVNLLEKLNTKAREKVIATINTYRKKEDLVVFSIHWGSNWGYDISVKQQNFAHSLIESGTVDVLFGHSSHHPKGIEIFKGHPIFYGCGDLINDYEGIAGREKFRDELRLMMFPRLSTTGALDSLRLIPLKMQRLQLQHPSEEERKWLLNKIQQESKDLGTNLDPYLDASNPMQ